MLSIESQSCYKCSSSWWRRTLYGGSTNKKSVDFRMDPPYYNFGSSSHSQDPTLCRVPVRYIASLSTLNAALASSVYSTKAAGSLASMTPTSIFTSGSIHVCWLHVVWLNSRCRLDARSSDPAIMYAQSPGKHNPSSSYCICD